MKNIIVLLVSLSILSCRTNSQKSVDLKKSDNLNVLKGIQESTSFEIVKPEQQWKAELSEQEYYVLREKGTERAFTGDLLANKDKGMYLCAACQYPLFDSETKFKSGTGWPSYYQPVNSIAVQEDTDYLLGYARTEVLCGRCGGHLGHVFSDGPKPTGLRYCINSVSLDFVKK